MVWCSSQYTSFLKVKNIVSLYLQILINIPAPPPAHRPLFQDKNLLPDKIFLETSHLPNSKRGSVLKLHRGLPWPQHRCQAEDEVREFPRNKFQPSQAIVPVPHTSSIRKCQEELRKQDCPSKRDARLLISFPTDFRLKGKK